MCGRRLQDQIDSVFGGMGQYVSGPQGAAIPLTAEQRMRQQVTAVRRLHQQYRPAFDHPDVCSHCTRGMDLVDWPCPTIQALDAS